MSRVIRLTLLVLVADGLASVEEIRKDRDAIIVTVRVGIGHHHARVRDCCILAWQDIVSIAERRVMAERRVLRGWRRTGPSSGLLWGPRLLACTACEGEQHCDSECSNEIARR